MKETFRTHGVCSRQIDFEIDEDKRVRGVYFHGGCAGNAKGVAALIEGMKAEDVIARLKGVDCRNGTSCPDQLAIALSAALKK